LLEIYTARSRVAGKSFFGNNFQKKCPKKVSKSKRETTESGRYFYNTLDNNLLANLKGPMYNYRVYKQI
jgi:hypothetical protein